MLALALIGFFLVCNPELAEWQCDALTFIIIIITLAVTDRPCKVGHRVVEMLLIVYAALMF